MGLGLGDLWPGVVKKRTVKSDNRKIKGENSFWSLNAARVPKILNYRTTSGWPLAVFAAAASAAASAAARCLCLCRCCFGFGFCFDLFYAQRGTN